MYNINKGNIPEDHSEILEPLHKLVRELLDLDAKQSLNNIEYTDADLVAAYLMFTTITANKLHHYLLDERASLGMANHLAETYGESIRHIVKAMTGVDVNTVYKKG